MLILQFALLLHMAGHEALRGARSVICGSGMNRGTRTMRGASATDTATDSAILLALHRTAPAASTSPSRRAVPDAAADIPILPPRMLHQRASRAPPTRQPRVTNAPGSCTRLFKDSDECGIQNMMIDGL